MILALKFFLVVIDLQLTSRLFHNLALLTRTDEAAICVAWVFNLIVFDPFLVLYCIDGQMSQSSCQVLVVGY